MIHGVRSQTVPSDWHFEGGEAIAQLYGVRLEPGTLIARGDGASEADRDKTQVGGEGRQLAVIETKLCSALDTNVNANYHLGLVDERETTRRGERNGDQVPFN